MVRQQTLPPYIHTYIRTKQVDGVPQIIVSVVGHMYVRMYVCVYVCMYVCMYAGTVMKGVLYRGYSLFFPLSGDDLI